MQVSWWPVLIALFAGAVLGAIVRDLLTRARITQLTLERKTATDAAARSADELMTARADAEIWRSRYQAEEVSLTRAESLAARVPSLEAELKELGNKVETLTASEAALQEQASRLVESETQLTAARDRLETIAGERSAFRGQADRVPGLDARITELTEQVVELTSAKSRLQTQLTEQATAQEQQVAVLTAVRGEIEKDLKNIASDALRSNQESFLQLAGQTFEAHKAGATADLEARGKAIEQLVAPVRETLQACQANLAEIEKTRAQEYGALSTELKGVIETQNAVRTETSKPVDALRAAPKTRGRWGEHTLRNVLELSELSAYCDFTTEESFERDGASLRPDVIIRLPGGRSLVVDAKTSMSAYLDAFEALDDETRDQHLALHATQLRTHVKQLAAKSYWDGLAETPDFVVMFVPGDNFYAAAAERDPKLFEDAVAQRVLIVTPATLIALAKAVAYGWRQEKVAENAKRVHELGKELYKRLSVMGGHIVDMGDNLSKTVKKYNAFVGSLEGSVMPQARHFNELEVEGTSAPIEPLETIEVEPRELRPDRDIVVPLPLPQTTLPPASDAAVSLS
jgi:DNA recombination protein RmuC